MHRMQTKLIGSLALALVLGGVPLLGGCDKVKSEKDVEVTHPDGTKDVEKQQTVQKPDGTIQQTSKKETSTSGPSTP